MAVHQNKRGYWQVTYRDETGKSRCKSFGKGRKAKAAAEAQDAEIRYLKTKGDHLSGNLSRVEGVYLDELVQSWIDERKARGCAARWLNEWATTFNKKFLEPLCHVPARTLCQADFVRVLSQHYSGVSQSTRNKYMRYLKAAIEQGVRQGRIQTNPLAFWKGGKEGRRDSKLTYADFLAIRAVAAKHLAWALAVAWAIPCRPGPSDLYALTFDNVDWERGGVRVTHSKTRRTAFIFLKARFLDELRERQKTHLSNHLIEYKGAPVQRLDTSLATAAKHAGLAYRPCMYDVRHLWITTALDRGLEPSVVAHMAGTSVEMIHRHYYEPHAVEAARAAEVMPDLQQDEPDEPEKKPSRRVVRMNRM